MARDTLPTIEDVRDQWLQDLDNGKLDDSHCVFSKLHEMLGFQTKDNIYCPDLRELGIMVGLTQDQTWIIIKRFDREAGRDWLATPQAQADGQRAMPELLKSLAVDIRTYLRFNQAQKELT